MKKQPKQIAAISAIFLLFLAAMILAASALVMAMQPTAARLNNRGNDDYARQAYEDALVAYQKAQIDEPQLAEPYFNAANALYRREAYAEALEQLEIALSFSADAELAEKGFFNLGNTFFNQQQLEGAVTAFKEALLRNPADPDAKYNLELALQTQQQLEEQQQQEEQEQEEQQENPENQQGEGEEQQEQSNEGENAQDKAGENAGEESEQESGTPGEPGEEEQQNGGGQPENGEAAGEETESIPAADGELTTDQATQLLNAIAEEAQTLQEALGKIISGPSKPPAQDW